MAQLKYCDKHNQVGFLRKPDESAGFAEIVDFLRGSNLRYALTTNPTIHDSLVKQFWQTATAKTLADGTLELQATIDTIAYTITEASIRRNMYKGVLKGYRPLLPAMFSNVAPSAGQEASSVTTSSTSYTVSLLLPLKVVNDSGEEKVEDISPSILKATESYKVKKDQVSCTKEKRYMRGRKEFKGNLLGIVGSFEEVKSAFEKVNTGGIRVSIPSLDRGRREGKAPMTEEDRTFKLIERQKAQNYSDEARTVAERSQNEQRKQKKKERLKESVLGKDLTIEDYAKRMNQGTWKLTQLKKLNFEEVKAEFENCFKTKTCKDKKLKFDDEGTQPTEEKTEEDKDDKPTKKTGKRRKQIARKGFHIDHDKDESKDSDEANEKDNSTSEGKAFIPDCKARGGENGTDMVYISFGAMLTDISRDDLTELYRIVMKKHGMNEPEDEFEKVLWEYLKNMFEEPLSTDSIWSLPEECYPLSAEVLQSYENNRIDELENLEWIEAGTTLGGRCLCTNITTNGYQSTMSNRHKDWLVQSKWLCPRANSYLVKAASNPLIADD
ncbi:hypothetical protein Tco_1429181 [Tanacetum coccineum]